MCFSSGISLQNTFRVLKTRTDMLYTILYQKPSGIVTKIMNKKKSKLNPVPRPPWSLTVKMAFQNLSNNDNKTNHMGTSVKQFLK